MRQRHPDLAVALLPIGAYEPRWFMRNVHMSPVSPDEAVQALELCGAAQAFWGTFRLTNEAIEQPAVDLAAACAARGIARNGSPPCHPGEGRTI